MNKAEKKLKELVEVGAGETVYFDHVEAGRHARARLTSMGLRRGTEFRVIRNTKNGPFIISLKDNRMLLGRGIIKRIMVAEKWAGKQNG